MKESELRELQEFAKKVFNGYPGLFTLDGRENLHNDLGSCVPTIELLRQIEDCRTNLYQLCDRIQSIPGRKKPEK